MGQLFLVSYLVFVCFSCSCLAFLEQMLLSATFRVVKFTFQHLLCFALPINLVNTNRAKHERKPHELLLFPPSVVMNKLPMHQWMQLEVWLAMQKEW